MWGILRRLWSGKKNSLEGLKAKDDKKFRKEHTGHDLVVACLNKKTGIVEHTVPLQNVWEGKVSIAMLVQPGEVPLGIRCSCHMKGMYAAFPTASRDLAMRLASQESAAGLVN
jgi:hypothetical protein